MTTAEPNSVGGQSAQRIVTLDVIRGIAVMGIFSVNVIGMAMIEAAYFYPPAWGWEGLADQIMWVANFILIDGKMRSLFSILFGASMLLVIERAAAAGKSPAKVHLARMAVLLAFGALHFYLIWWGDILLLYAVVGAVAFLLWKLPVKWLLLASIGLFAWEIVPGMTRVPASFAAYEAAHAPGASAEAVKAWERRSAFLTVTPQEAATAEAMHASPVTHARVMIRDRALDPVDLVRILWTETLALMLLGMAGYRSGFLTGEWSDRAYRRIAAVGIGLGGAGFAGLAAWVVASGFRMPEVSAAFFTLSGPVRPVMAIGYAALIVLLFRRAGAVRDRFAAVGRAAFTNYLGASLIGLIAFFDTGLGLFGALSRAEAWLLVPLTWAAMLAWSKPWLDRYRFGPFEWAWRSLARWEMQPMRKAAPVGPLAMEA